MRKIPRTMATQHPDNAFAPYWEKDGDGFVSVQEEVGEAHSAFSDLGCEEFMWDWEGKYVDEAVGDKLFSRYQKYFQKNPLGVKKFLTFRIPNIWQEKGYSLARAFMGILTFETVARDLGFSRPPVFEVILPMCDDAQKPIQIQRMFLKLAQAKHKIFNSRTEFEYLNIIPLIEGVNILTFSKKILKEYLWLHKKYFGKRPEYLRPFIARSDPALNAGNVAATLSAKIALSEYFSFSREYKIPVFPIIGVGSLPFRGGFSPLTIKKFFKEYPGVYTTTIQSSFRYDFPLPQVKRAIRSINAQSFSEAYEFTKKELNTLRGIIKKFTLPYQRTVEKIANDINALSLTVPKQRERRLHIGLFGYSRNLGKKKLPRAISFTAVLYSLGVPPEIIGVGRGWEDLTFEEKNLLKRVYRGLIDDLKSAGQFVNLENLNELIKKNQAWQDYKKDLDILKKEFSINFGPKTTKDFLHRNFSSNVLLFFKQNNHAQLTNTILQAARLRRSLG